MVPKKQNNISGQTNPFKGLSERALNAISISRLNTVPALLSHYNRFGNFLQLRHCGAKTNKELISFAEKLILNGVKDDAANAQNKGESGSESSENAASSENSRPFYMNSVKDSSFKIYQKIPLRSKNVLHLNGITSPQAFLAYYRKNGDFKTLRHCGEVTNQKLTGFAKEMIEAIAANEHALG